MSQSPSNDDTVTSNTTTGGYVSGGGTTGWVCPLCGKVLAPWVSEHQCYKVEPIPVVPYIPYVPYVPPYPWPEPLRPTWFIGTNPDGSIPMGMGVENTADV